MRLALTFALLLGGPIHSWGAEPSMPSPEDMWRMLQAQQAQIERLETELAALRDGLDETADRVTTAEATVVETQEQVAVTAEAIDEVMTGAGSGPSGAGGGTKLGGYGEVHLNIADGRKHNQIDFHRWVLFLEHDFSDSIHLVSEVELEHSLAGDGAPGEVELEQAYVQFDLTDATSAKGGLFLMPVGLLNEFHEPAFFYGVERNKVESRIIPTTWWEAGAALTHRTPRGWSFDLALTSGLDNPDGVIRSGRQKVAEAVAQSPALTGRVQYTGIPGLKVGGSVFHQEDLNQSGVEKVRATLLEGHVDLRKGPFGLRALYAHWLLDGEGIAATAEEQFGYYIEPSFRFETDLGEWGLFARFSHYEYQRNPTAFRADDLWEAGVNYWPIEQVVLKVDYQYAGEAEELAGEHWYNLGLGYHF